MFVLVFDYWKLIKKPKLCFDTPQGSYFFFNKIRKCFAHKIAEDCMDNLLGRLLSTHWKIDISLLRDP